MDKTLISRPLRQNQTKSYPLLLWPSLTLFLYASCAWSAADADDFLQPFVNESLTYDSNLFRASSDVEDDFINRASAGGRIRKTLSRQVFDLDLRVDDNRYAANQLLDHVSTQDSALWNWQAGRNWSGKLGAEYTRSLAGFANTGFFKQDLLDQPAYYLDARYQLNPHWCFDGGYRLAETMHSATSRQNQDIQSQTGRGGVTYLTRRGNSVGVEYRHTDAEFPRRPLSPTQDIAYQENTASALLKYDYSPKLHVEGQAGYLLRSHPNVDAQDFQGAIWRINLGWAPTVKTLVTISSWHELTAFTELATNYYVSEGVSVAPSWAVTEKIVLSGQARMESQDHVGNDNADPNVGLRQDELFSSQISASYIPASFAEFNLAYQFYERDSNKQRLSYVGDSVTATVQLKF